MEEEVTTAPANRTVLILLGVIALLLVVIVVYIFTSTGKAPVGNTGTGTTPPANTGTTEVPFDPATATVVAAGITPEDHVRQYFDAIIAADYATAYQLLPTAKQQTYGSAEAFGSQLAGYNITAYEVTASEETGDQWVVQVAVQSSMSASYIWTFVKDGENWLVQSREVSMQ